MCGLAGWVGSSKNDETIQKMTECIIHRGPDDSGVFAVDTCTLGSRRLSIIDVAGGHMPMLNADGSMAIAFNGEVYNFAETRKELEALGYTFQTKGDTETVLLAYEEWGADSLQRHNGMFAFAIWDSKKEELFIARDRLGIKPLYYTEVDGVLVFGSEIKSLLAYPGVEASLNYSVLDQYFTFRYTPANETIFEGIYKLAPGHYMTWKAGVMTIEKYWDVRFDVQDDLDEAEALEKFERLFRDSVERRMIADVPLGAFLSGGLDSSYIVAIMVALSQKPVETFSVGFDDRQADESDFAKVVADVFETNHHTLRSDPKGIELLPEILWHLDEPLADAAVIPTYQISAVVREHVTVGLSGEGSDELLAGYDKLFFLHWANRLKGFFRLMMPFIPGGSVKRDRAKAFFSQKNDARAYFDFISVFTEEDKKRLYTDVVKKATEESDGGYELVAQFIPEKDSRLEDYLNLDLHTWLPNDLLLKGDRMTMAHSLEGRVPFLDHTLVEFAATFPTRFRIWGKKNKYILREAMKKVLPDSIVNRKKHGFSVPLEMYRPIIENLLSVEAIEKRGLFNVAYVQELVARDYRNSFYRRQVWALVVFEIWAQIYLDGESIDTVRARLQES